MNKKKIEFEDKLKSLEINSIYVISSENVNEIKHVVNAIVDIVPTNIDLNINTLCKYILISLPEQLEDINYSLIITVNGNDVLNSKTDPSAFFIFKNNKFEKMLDGIFTYNDSGSVILIETSSFLNKNIDIDLSYKLVSFEKEDDDYENPTSNHYAMGLSPFKKVNNFKETKFLIVRNENELSSYLTTLDNFGFEEFNKQLSYFYNEDDTNISLSSIIYDPESADDTIKYITSSDFDIYSYRCQGFDKINKFFPFVIPLNTTYKNINHSTNISGFSIPKSTIFDFIIEDSGTLTENEKTNIISSSIITHNNVQLNHIELTSTSSLLVDESTTFDETAFTSISSNIKTNLNEFDNVSFFKKNNQYPIKLDIDFKNNKSSINNINDELELSIKLINSYGESKIINSLDELNSLTILNNDKLYNILTSHFNKENNLILKLKNNESIQNYNANFIDKKFILFKTKLKNGRYLFDVKEIEINGCFY